jgi:hypothetical protein
VELDEERTEDEETTACCFWDLRTGLPSSLGISEMSPMKADSGMSKHNTEAKVDTGLMPHFAALRRHVIAPRCLMMKRLVAAY